MTHHIIQCVSFTTKYGLLLTNCLGRFTISARATHEDGVIWLFVHEALPPRA